MGLCSLKVLLNLYSIAVVQQHFHQNLLFKPYQVKEKKYNKCQSLFLQTDIHESFVPGRYQDGHEYYIQLVK